MENKFEYKQIETEEEYRYYLERFEEIFQTNEGEESEEADILSKMIGEYESKLLENE